MVAAVFVTHANEDRFTLAGDEDICFFVDGDAITSKNGNGAIITGLTYAHEGLRENPRNKLVVVATEDKCLEGR